MSYTKEKTYSVAVLILTNVINIFLAIFQQWDLLTVMWVYWFQSVIIGIFQFRKMMDLKTFSTEGLTINDMPVSPTEDSKKFVAYFFLVHYGFFHLGYLLFLRGSATLPVGIAIFLGSAVFFLNHFSSYQKHKNKVPKSVQNIGAMVFFPYARIIPMHIIIVTGSFLVGGPKALVLFMILKTAADVMMHRVEHNGEVSST